MKKIRVDINVPGQGKESHEYEYCLIQIKMGNSRTCPLREFICNYGLTTIEPPKSCPLNCADVLMKFSIVEDKTI